MYKMDYIHGLTLLSILLCIVRVYGQACPEGTTAAQMCVPGTYTGERVLIDTASYDPSVNNCSCTFGTTSSVLKLVTYVAPNYPECNSAVRLYSSSGNSIRFQCLMSGTYLDTSVHNVGVTTFEEYGDLYDKNYCLMMEIAGRIGDTVTVTCSGDIQADQITSAITDAENNTDAVNTSESTINNTVSDNSQNVMNVSTETNTSVINVSTTYKSLLATTTTVQETSTNAETPSVTTGTDATNASENTTVESVTEGLTQTTPEVLRQTSTESSSTVAPQDVVMLNASQIVNQRDVNNTYHTTPKTPLNLDLTFSKMIENNVSNTIANNETTNGTLLENMNDSYVVTNDRVGNVTANALPDKNETSEAGFVTTLVTGTVLFNGGDKNSPKTIQSIGAVPETILLGQGNENAPETSTNNTVPAPNEESTSYNNSETPAIEISKSSNEPVDTYEPTQPFDISNLLVMEPISSEVVSDVTEPEIGSNYTDYSLQFPSFNPVQTDENNPTDIINHNIAGENITGISENTLYLTTNYETSLQNTNETKYIDSNNNTTVEVGAESNTASLSLPVVDTETVQTGNTDTSNADTTGILKTSPFMTNEVRFTMEITEPNDIVANVTTGSIGLDANTTFTATDNVSAPLQDSSNMTESVTLNETYTAGKPNFTNGHVNMESNAAITDVASDVVGQTSDSKYINQTQETSQLTQSTPANNIDNTMDSLSPVADTNATGDASNTIIMTDTIVDPLTDSEEIVNYTSQEKMHFVTEPTTPKTLNFMADNTNAHAAVNTDMHNSTSDASVDQSVSLDGNVLSRKIPNTKSQAVDNQNGSYETSTHNFQRRNIMESTVSAVTTGNQVTTETSSERTPESITNIKYENNLIPENRTTEQSLTSINEGIVNAPSVNHGNNLTTHVNVTDVTRPSMNETSENYFQSVGDMNLSEMFLNETSLGLTEDLSNISFVHRENVKTADFGTYIPVASDGQKLLPRNEDHASKVTTTIPTQDPNMVQTDEIHNVKQDTAFQTGLTDLQAPPAMATQYPSSFANVDQGSIAKFETVYSDVPQEITTPNIDQAAFVPAEGVQLSDKVTTARLPGITTTSYPSTKLETMATSNLNDATNRPETGILTKDTPSSSFEDTVRSSDLNTTEAIPETSTKYINEQGGVNESGSDLMLQSNSKTFSTQSLETTTTTSTYVKHASIDQHNFLTFTETYPSNIYQDTVAKVETEHRIQTTQIASQTTVGSGVAMFTDKTVTEEQQQTTNNPLLSSKLSREEIQPNDLTVNLPETFTETSQGNAQSISTEAPVTDTVQYTDNIVDKALPVDEVMVQKKTAVEEAVVNNMLLTEKITSAAPERTTQSDPMVSSGININSLMRNVKEQMIKNETEPAQVIDFLAELEKEIIYEESSTMSTTGISSSTDLQITTETKQSTHSIDIQSTASLNTQEQTTTIVTKVVDKEHTTQVSTSPVPELKVVTDGAPVTIKTNAVVDIAPPEPIIPKRPTVAEAPVPTTPVERFNVIGDTVVTDDSDSIRKVKNTEGGRDMNVYFDTGRSNEPYEMSNDTYIIVVGAIVGLVVLAVVIGIFCHNSRKSRSEKVNISGNGEQISHRNQAFDSGAADVEQGTNGAVNGVDKTSGPEGNGATNGVSGIELNANVDLS